MSTATPSADSSSSPPFDEDKYLDECVLSVRRHAFQMKHAGDGGKLRDLLKHASIMCSELRTSKLSPKNYYELYMSVTDELRELEAFFSEQDEKSGGTAGEKEEKEYKSIVELYENVQHAGNIVPRLYLLITVASVYIRTKKAPAKDILFDLVELCRGVQHPMRGLFLRNYLSQISKDKLPDVGSEYEGHGGSVKDSIEFILQNFSEMNKLWVRMSHLGSLRDRQRREKERRNIRQLIGTNLVRLSELSGVDLSLYVEYVLPRILEVIVNCKDQIAQEYLMDVIIQVFPDEFHLSTLETFLSTCAQLQDSVNVKDILIALMNRLASFAATNAQAMANAGGPAQLEEMFPLFHRYSGKIISSNSRLALPDILSLQVALLNFAVKVYPSRREYVDLLLGQSVDVLQKKEGKEAKEKGVVKLIVELLTIALEALGLPILSLANYGPLLALLELDQRRSVCLSIMQHFLKQQAPLDTMESVETLFSFLAPCLRDENPDKSNAPLPEDEKFEFDNEQNLVARLFHLIQNEDTDVLFSLYQTSRKHFGRGGTHRVEYTLPPLVFRSLQLAERIYAREQKGEDVATKSKKLFLFIHETISVLTPLHPVIALRLFLHAASVADSLLFEAIAYEFFVQAFIAYEDEINDSKQQLAAIQVIVASLQTMRSFGQENYDTLVSKATQHSAKLLKKTEQCRSVYQCAHLFWPAQEPAAAPAAGADGADAAAPSSPPLPPLSNAVHRDEKRVLACLQRSLKIANGCMGQQVQLFVEILAKYLFFYERACPSISVKYLKGLISLIEEHSRALDASDASRAARVHYENTLIHIKQKQQQGGEMGERYRAITEGDRVDSTDVDHQ